MSTGRVFRNSQNHALDTTSGGVIALWFCYAAIPLAYALALSIAEPDLAILTNEDHLVENLGAGFFLLAGLTALWSYIYSRQVGPGNHFFGRHTSRNIWFLFLAVFFMVCFGEEIAWGQRIAGWVTPEAWRLTNVQGETTIHNLSFLQESDDHSLLGWAIRPNRLLSMFWVGYCVVLPIALRYSAPCRRIIHYLGIPPASLRAGGLFVLNIATLQAAVFMFHPNDMVDGGLDEIKETIAAAAFFVMTFLLYRHQVAITTALVPERQRS